MNILAIETSCDETSAAVVKDGTEVLSSIISSQNDFHAKYGGIVPEIASRKHIESISPVIKEAMERAAIGFKDLDAIATTFGPGLPGSLIVGLSAAKAISFALKKPLIGVNHLEGHIYANFLLEPKLKFPFICLIVSGGHTQLVKVTGHMEFETLGRTRDDAAGEAYDKVARFLGLGYPGGPIIDKLAKTGNENAVNFTRPMLARQSPGGGGLEEEYKYDFSFSGIKTAVVYYVKKNPPRPLGEGLGVRVDIAASFQKAVVDTLVEKTIRAAEENSIKTVAIGGGVAANSKLRADMKAACKNKGIKCIVPPLELCTDNAAMIGCAGYFRYKKGMVADYSLAIESTARIG